jgi:hypothetical protein
LKLGDGELSASHFELRVNPAGIFLKDLDSEGGNTTVNGNTLNAGIPLAIEPGEEFVAGRYVFRWLPVSLQDTASPETGTSTVKLGDRVRQAATGIGKRRLLLFAGGILAAAVFGALLVYFALIKPRFPIQPINQTAAVVEEHSTTTPVEGGEPVQATPTFGLSVTQAVGILSETIVAPGEGAVDLQSLNLSGSGISLNQLYQLAMDPNQSLEMVMDIYGENIAFAYIFSGILVNDRVQAVLLEYIQADETQLVDGVVAPDWGDDPEIPLDFEWHPYVNKLTDGENEVVVLLQPERYAVSADAIVYRVEGIYEPEGSMTRYDAILRFDGTGNLLDVMTYGVLGTERGTPYKVNPEEGDRFVVYDLEFLIDPETEEDVPLTIPNAYLSPELQLLLLNALKTEAGFGYGQGEFTRREGGAIVFASEPIRWFKDETFSGEYAAGFAVQDLDNNFYVGYIPVVVSQP